jgi:pimeloyl-ACP methyl ester carboxylesterase
MGGIVCVHGIAQQVKGEDELLSAWVPALRSGVRLACGDAAAESLIDCDIRCAFYGDLFRPPGRYLSGSGTWIDPDGLDDFEQDLLFSWWERAATTDPRVIGPDERTLGRTPRSVKAALRALSNARFLSGLGDQMLLGALRQVRQYATDPQIRQAAISRVTDLVNPETRVIVAHSLGTVVAYEALCANPSPQVRALVTLGSPLGIRGLIFDRLIPAPKRDKFGAIKGDWPGGISEWTNIADDGDIVALVEDLRPLFEGEMVCAIVHNDLKAHDVRPYLTSRETGLAICSGLR